jgi:hypothetical protein
MRTGPVALIVGCLIGIPVAHAAETFSFDMPESRLRFVVPDIPQMKMAVHPNAKAQPHARYLGSDSTGYSISILMPTADAGMSPRDCATSGATSVMQRFGVDPKFIVRRQTSESTFVMLFPFKAGPLVQLKAFMLSADNASHCIEVHISKTVVPSTAEAVSQQLPGWLQGFSKAKIEKY